MQPVERELFKRKGKIVEYMPAHACPLAPAMERRNQYLRNASVVARASIPYYKV